MSMNVISLDEYAPHRTATFNGEEIEVYGVDVAMFIAPMNQITEDYTKEVMTKVEAFKKSDQSAESAEIFAQGMVESFAESMTRYTPGADIAEIAITAVEYNEAIYTEDSSISVKDTDYSSIEPYEVFELDGTVTEPTPIVKPSVPVIPANKLIPPLVSSISFTEITGTASSSGYVDVLINFSPAYINSNPAAWVEYYEVLYTTEPDLGWQVLGKTNNTSQILKNAVVGTEYFFAVKPYTNFRNTNAPERNEALKYANSYTPTGLFDVTNNITDFNGDMTEQGVVFTWEDSDIGKTYEIHYGEAIIASGISGNTFLYPKWLNIGTHNFTIYSIDGLKNKSETAMLISIEITAPLPATSLSATGGYHDMKLGLSYPKEGGFDYVEVWSNTVNAIETAVMVGTTRTDELMHSGLDNSDVRYYWARIKDYIGNYSNWYPAVDGVIGITDSGSNQLLSELSDKIAESELTETLRGRIDAIDVDNPDFVDGVLHDGIEGSLIQEFRNHHQFLKDHDSSLDAIKEQVDQLMLTGEFESHNTSAEAHDGKINLNAMAITGRLALEEGIVDKGVVVMGVDDIPEGLDIKITNAFIDIDAVNGRIAQEVGCLDEGFTRLELDLDGVSTTVYEEEEGLVSQVTQMSNLYTVKFEDIKTKKVLAGFGLHADSSEGISEFIVSADRFAVISPEVDEEQYIFYVDKKSNKIAMRPDLIVDGSITSEKLVTGQLVVGDNIRIADGAVDWSKNVSGAGKPADNADVTQVALDDGANLKYTKIEDENGNLVSVFNGRKIATDLIKVTDAQIKNLDASKIKSGILTSKNYEVTENGFGLFFDGQNEGFLDVGNIYVQGQMTVAGGPVVFEKDSLVKGTIYNSKLVAPSGLFDNITTGGIKAHKFTTGPDGIFRVASPAPISLDGKGGVLGPAFYKLKLKSSNGGAPTVATNYLTIRNPYKHNSVQIIENMACTRFTRVNLSANAFFDHMFEEDISEWVYLHLYLEYRYGSSGAWTQIGSDLMIIFGKDKQVAPCYFSTGLEANAAEIIDWRGKDADSISFRARATSDIPIIRVHASYRQSASDILAEHRFEVAPLGEKGALIDWVTGFYINSVGRAYIKRSNSTAPAPIVERGSNANGEYTKLADGTMVCWRFDIYSNLSVPAENTFIEPNTLFPVNFHGDYPLSKSMSFAAADRTNTHAILLSFTDTAGSSSWRYVVKNESTPHAIDNLTIRKTAIGRWY